MARSLPSVRMAIEWISADKALKYVSLGEQDFASRTAICQRAHFGLLASRARLLNWNGEEKRFQSIPKEFWWAEGFEALEQDWMAGDFSTWLEKETPVRAFGVEFDFVALSELVPADLQAQALRSISVVADPNWITAREMRTMMFEKVNPYLAGAAIVEACRLGQLAGRAMRCVGKVHVGRQVFDWATVEWDIPLWFWRDFVRTDNPNVDWPLGKSKARGIRHGNTEDIELSGIHFHRSGLRNLGFAETQPIATSLNEARRGRRPEYDWTAASSAIWGQLFRGDLKPETQADVEKALIGLLAKGDKEPSESTVRPYAKAIWEEFQKP